MQSLVLKVRSCQMWHTQQIGTFLCTAMSSSPISSPVAYQPTISSLGNTCLSAVISGDFSTGPPCTAEIGKTTSLHCSVFLVSSPSSITNPEAVLSYTNSKELLTSTTRPACCPSRHPNTRGGGRLASCRLALALVWWSLTFSRTSCDRHKTVQHQIKPRRLRLLRRTGCKWNSSPDELSLVSFLPAISLSCWSIEPD